MATLEKSELDISLERLTPQWLAGFFDGEGCISISVTRGMPQLQVNISQSEYQTLWLIGQRYGGKEPYKKYSKVKHWKQGWSVAWYGKTALPFLEAIRPHVLLKRKLVEWAIEMANLHGDRGEFHERPERKGSGPRASAPRIKARKEELMGLVKSENKSGRLPIQ